MQSNLAELTRERGAEFADYDAWQMPAHYGDPGAEYSAAHATAILRDTSHLSRFRIAGADHLSFLHRMSTNHFEGLEDSAGFEAVFPDNRGRILECGAFYRRGDTTLAVLSPPARQSLPSWLDRYIFAEDIALQDLAEETAMVEICGPQATSIVASVLGKNPGDVADYHLLDHGAENDLWCMRLDHLGHAGLRLVGPVEPVRDLWKQLLDAGALPCGEQSWDVLRVEAGLPAHGRELTEEHNPWEANLTHAIHMDKGCYIGQEVIARLDTYEKVKQHLMGLHLPAGSRPDPGTQFRDDNREVGKITSVVHSPRLDRKIALAYVRNAFCAPGTHLQFSDNGTSHIAEVVALPFVQEA